MITIAGLIPFTTIDYPGCLSAVVFCQGCPWRCGYCHNPHLQPFENGTISWNELMDFLKSRQGLLDAVVFSGGEPTLQKNLSFAMRQIKRMNFKIGLHTAGIHPHCLEPVLPWVDWVGMDIKAPFEDYERITKVPKSGEKARESAQLLIQSKVDYEFRTTVHPHLLTPSDIDKMTKQLEAMGARRFVLQPFQTKGCTDPALLREPYEILWSRPFLDELSKRFETFFVRYH